MFVRNTFSAISSAQDLFMYGVATTQRSLSISCRTKNTMKPHLHSFQR